MGRIKTNIKTTPFLSPFPCSASLQTPLPTPGAVEERWRKEVNSQSITVLLSLSLLTLFLCCSVGSSTGCSPVRKIFSPQVAVPSGISICSGVFLSAGCKGISALPWRTSFSFLWPWCSLLCFSLFLFPLSLWRLLPFFKRSFQRDATHLAHGLSCVLL